MLRNATLSKLFSYCCSSKDALRFISVIIITAMLNIGGCGGGGGGGLATGPDDAETTGLNRLNLEILNARITANREVVTTFKLTDELGNPVNRSELDRIGFIIARIVDTGEYINYLTRVRDGAVQADADRGDGGTYTNLGPGMYEYTLEEILPANYDANATHTLAMYARRMIGSQRWVSNDTFDWVPAGGAVRVTRNIVDVTNCNTCHNPLAIHGGTRRDTKLCITCHTSEIVDPDTGERIPHIDGVTGNNIGLKIMAHKIHMGAELPSVQDGGEYIVGGHDYSHLEFPQDIRNCTKCHNNAAQADNYKDNPTRAACGSCHDNIDFQSGDGHPNVQLTDNNCSGCHVPDSGTEFDISVVGAHTVPLKSKSLPGVNFEIVSVTSNETSANKVGPGQHAKVVYSIRTNSGAIINPSDMGFLELTIAGPTDDYDIQDYNGDGVLTPGEENILREFPAGGSTGPDANGNFTYVFNGMIPLDASGSYAIGLAGRIPRNVGGDGLVLNETVNEAGRNVVKYFPVTDTVAQMRRLVVDNSVEDDYCTSCHGEFSRDFSIHGNIRNNTEYCVLCHNPSHDDIAVRPLVGGSAVTESINFRKMIHKIHTGEELNNKPYIIYGFGGSLHDFSEVLFPGATNDCESCHIKNTNALDPGKGILGPGIMSTLTRRFTKSGDDNVIQQTFSVEPVITVCTSCHDHLIVNASGNGIMADGHLGGARNEDECVDCHIAGDPLGAQEVHLPGLSPDLRINRPQ